MRNVLIVEFPGGQAGALAAGAGFISVDENLLAAPVRGVHGRQCRAVVNEREPAGVAMRFDATAVGYEFVAKRADGFAGGGIFVR